MLKFAIGGLLLSSQIPGAGRTNNPAFAEDLSLTHPIPHADPMQGSQTATSRLATNCWGAATSYPAYTPPLDILSEENLRKHIGAPQDLCEPFVQAMMDSYKRRPLTKRILRILLGQHHEITFSISPESSNAVRQDADMTLMPYSGSVVFSSLNPPNHRPLQVIDIYETQSAKIRHQIIHLFFEKYNQENDDEFKSAAFVNEALAAYAQSREAIKTLERLYTQNKRAPHSLTEAEQRTLKQKMNQAKQGKTLDTQHIEELHLLTEVIYFLDNRLLTFADPIVKAEELFTHLWVLFSEQQNKDFFPFFYNTLHDKAKKVDLTQLKPYEGVVPSGDFYDFSNLRALNLKKSQAFVDAKNHAIYLNDAQDLAPRVRAYYNDLVAFIQTRHKEHVQSTVDYYEMPRTQAVVNALAEKHVKEYIIVQRTLGIGHYYLGTLENKEEHFKKAHQHFKAAIKKEPHSLSTEELRIVDEVANALNKPLYGSTQRQIKKL